MENRIILLIDMDYFFAQIEERSNPRFKGLPVVIGADPKGGSGRGVVSTANYIARKFGIHSALPISRAYRLCPDAIFLPPDMELYLKVSGEIMEIIKKYSFRGIPSKSEGLPLGFEQVSLDEAYLDISFLKDYKKAEELARSLKKEILEKENLTATVGIGPNKMIAKMAAGKAKPDGLMVINPKEAKDFLEPLDIDDMPGVGPKTAAKLRALGICRIGDVKKLSGSDLKNIFGKWGELICERAQGIDEREVFPHEAAKSIGRDYTFEKDTRESKIIFGIFDELIKDLCRKIKEEKIRFKTITVVCRFSGFETHTKSKTLKNFIKSCSILKKEAKNMLLRFLLENPKYIRLIGVRISSFSEKIN